MNEHYQPEQTKELLEQLQAPRPTVIALEGGPCGGKTTVLDQLDLIALSHEHDRPLVLLPEAATLHANALHAKGQTVPDLAANDREGFLTLEKNILQTIIGSIQSAVETHKNTNAIIVADRVDIGTYVTPLEHGRILHAMGMDRPPHLKLVDKMVFLPSLAQIDPVLYDELAATNPARYETAESAIETCNRNLGSVAMHPELSMHWTGNFEEKVQGALSDILFPEKEIEAKFTAREWINYDGLEYILEGMGGTKLDSTYLQQSYHEIDGQEFRLRRGYLIASGNQYFGDEFYHFAIKSGEGSTKHELRRNLTREEYRLLLTAQRIGVLLKQRDRYLLPDGDGKRILSADFYHHRPICVLEIEGVNDEQAERFEIPGFNRGGVSARKLVQ